MKHKVLLLLFSFFVSLASEAQTRLTLDKVAPPTNTSITSSEAIQMAFSNAIDPYTLNFSAIAVKGNYTGSYNRLERGYFETSKNEVSFSTRYGFKPNERIQISATSVLYDFTGMALSNPKVYNYRVQTNSRGNGSFVDSLYVQTETASLGSLFQLADMDNNGTVDIVEYDSQGSIVIHANYGKSFESYVMPSAVTAPLFMHLADLSDDGYPDVIVVRGSGVGFYVYDNDGGSISTQPRLYETTTRPLTGYQDDYIPISGDVDADGDLDLVFGNGATITVMMNDPVKRAFIQQSIKVENGSGNAPVFVDVDNDGDIDIVTQSGQVSTNDGDGNFSALANVATTIISSEEVDFDNDGDIDLAQLVNGSKALQLQLLENSNGVYKLYKTLDVAKANSTATSLFSGDYNGDGWLDLGFSASEPTYSNKLIFLYNDGKGNYDKPVASSVKRMNNFSATADMDGDGDLDFVGLVNEAGLDEKYFMIYYNGIPCNSPLVVRMETDNPELPACGMLRYAIDYASLHQGLDTIRFDLPKGSTIALYSELRLEDHTVIEGPGSDYLSIVGSENNTIFNMFGTSARKNTRLEAAGDTTYITGLTLEKGAQGVTYALGGSLILKDCKIKDNTYNYGTAGLYFYGENLLVENCEISGNRIPGELQQGSEQGAGAYVNSLEGRVVLRNSTFDGNTGGNNSVTKGSGHGLYLTGDNYTALIEGCTFSNNRAVNGGALYYQSNRADSLAILNTTFSGNIVREKGAAIFVAGPAAKLSLQNVTITSNGLDSLIEDTDGPLKYYTEGGGIYLQEGKLYTSNTVLAGNHGFRGRDIYNYKASVISTGGNLFGVIGDNSNTVTPLSSDQYGNVKLPLDPKFAALGDNGGPTLTHLPLSGSPVIDKGINKKLNADQRGFTRISGTTIDVGSVEYVAYPTVYAGKDSILCGNTITLYATPVATAQQATHKGYWKNLDTKVKGTFTDSTKYNTSAKLSYGANRFAWSITNGTVTKSDTISITSYYLAAKAAAGVDKMVFKDTTTLRGNVPSSNTTIRWKVLAGGSTLTDSTKSTTLVSKLALGTNRFEYRYGISPCVSRDTIVVQYIKIDTAKAGKDFTSCTDTNHLSANVPTKGNTTKWTILKGSVKLAVDTAYNTKISNLKDSVAVLVWSETNLASGVITRDTIQVFRLIVGVQITRPDTVPSIIVTSKDVALNAKITGTAKTHVWYLNKVSLGASVPVQTTAKITADTNVFRFTATNGICVSSDSIKVIFKDSTKAYAGADQFACTDSTVLAALKPAAGYMGQWTVIGGSAQVANDTLFNAKVKNLRGAQTGTGINVLVWSLWFEDRLRSRDTVVVTYSLRPTRANAGIDKIVTTDTTSLVGNIDGTALSRWRVLSGGSTLSDSTKAKTFVSVLNVGTNRFVYVLKDVCERKDTVQVTFNLPRTTAGRDLVTCTDTVRLSAGTAPHGFTGAWRTKNTSVVIRDSTLATTRLSSLPVDSIPFVWVIKRAGIVYGRDTVVVTRARTPAISLVKDTINTCLASAEIQASKLQALENGFWTSLGYATIDSANAAKTRVQNLERVFLNSQGRVINALNRFVWTVSNGRCSASDTVVVYSALNILSLPDTVSPKLAGSSFSVPVTVNDLYSPGDQLQKLNVRFISQDSSAIIKKVPDDLTRTITFFTSSKIYAKNLVIKYEVSNQCPGVKDTAYIYINTTNAPPVAKTFPVQVESGKKQSFVVQAVELDANPNIDSVHIFPNQNKGVASASLSSDGAQILISVDYSAAKGFVGTENFRYEVCDVGADGVVNCSIDSILVTITEVSPGKVFVYNALSPNGDGKNDVIEIDRIENYPDNKLRIFNRWGDKVYSVTGYNGTTIAFDGKDLPDGTYYYVLELGDGEKPEEGYILLKR